MTTSAKTDAPAVRAALQQLVDYAGLFPPAQLAMAAALDEYAAARSGSFAWMLARFIVPASRVHDLLELLPLDGEPVALSVIVDAGSEARTWLANVQRALSQLRALRSSENRVRIDALEIALPPLSTQRETYDAAIGQFAAAVRQDGVSDIPAFVELPRDARWSGELNTALYALARHHLGAKLRCGGVVAQAFPSSAEVAAFIASAIGEYTLPMKCTAGLHHPVYHHDAALDVMMHGFLNILGAVAASRAGASRDELATIIECTDVERLRPGAPGLSAEQIQNAREKSFIAYGSCSFSEPTGDLQALGVL
jgi:hypothetical protein